MDIVDKMKLQRHRESTCDNYYRVWKIFSEFFIKLDSRPDTWEDRIILFVGYLIINNKKSSTIKSYVSAIKSVLIDDNKEVSEDRVLLEALTRACRLHFDINYHKLPVKQGLFNLMIDTVPKLFPSPQQHLITLYQAMLATAYYGLFRIREITESPHVIKAKDVHVGHNKNKLMFVLHSSKTHNKSSKPQIIKIAAANNGNNCNRCPFRLLQNYTYRYENEQFFIFSNGDPVKGNLFCAIFKKLIKFNNLDPAAYTVHGIRPGRAVDLLDMGVSVETIKK